MLFTILRNIVIVFVLFGLLYSATKLSPDIKNQVYTTASKVLGANTQSVPKDANLSENLKKDAGEQIDTVKDKAMDLTLNEFVYGAKRLGKIPEDLALVRKEAENQIKTIITGLWKNP